MTLILLQVIIQSIASTLYWIGLCVGIHALSGERSRRLRWTLGSAVVLVVWLVGVILLAASGTFRPDAPGIPIALGSTLAAGCKRRRLQAGEESAGRELQSRS